MRAEAATTTVNLMVVYSAEAKSSVPTIDTLIDQAVAQNNVYFQNSQVNVRFSLVHKGVVNHVEHSSMTTVLERLKHPSDGFLDDIFALRQSRGADLICLITQQGTESGWAFIMGTPHVGFRNQAFSIIRADQLSNHKLIAHEIAHTMGCNHDSAYTFGPLCYSFSKAYNFTGTDGVAYGTICSQRPNIAPLFGNPAVNFAGVPSGSSAENNARTINDNASILQQFRFAPPPEPANNAFAGRIAISGYNAVVGANNELATRESGEPSHSSTANDTSTAWWTWTAPASGQVTLNTFGSDFDTCLAVYTGDSLGNLLTVGRNDNSPGGPYNSQVASQVIFSAINGGVYQIAVGGMNRDVGNIVLSLSLPGGPPVPPASLFIDDTQLTEGNSGTKEAAFTVRLNSARAQTISADFTTVDGTGRAGTDYTGTNGVVVFPPATTNQTVRVRVTGDTLSESNETFLMRLSNPVNAGISRTEAVGTIVDDDGAPPPPPLAGVCSRSALQFDGVDDYVEVPFASGLNVTGRMTIEAWIYRYGSGQQSIAEKYDCNGIGGYVLRIGSGSKPMFGTRDDCNGGSTVSGATTLNLNTWYHLAGVWDGTNALIYVNGVLDGSLATTRNPKAGATPLRIGVRGNDLRQPFSGIIDEVRLWNVARSGNAIQGSMNSLLAGNETGLAGLWRFDEGSGSQTADGSSSRNDAALINSPIWVQAAAPLICPIEVTTLAATNISINSALLRGTAVVANGPGNAWFEWWIDGITNRTVAQAAPTGTNLVTQTITSLTPGTTYSFRIVGVPSTGATNYGEPLNFTTLSLPSLSIGSVSTTEGASGPKPLTFTVTRTGFAGVNVSVAWNAVENTAAAGTDFGPTNGVLSLASNQTSAQIVVNVLGDELIEANETFFLRLFNPTNATLSSTQAIATIQNDDYLQLATTSATNINISSATLRGTALALESANVWFEWWSEQQTNRTSVLGVSSGTNTTLVSQSVSGLNPGSSYSYRIVGSTPSAGTNFGAPVSFSTPALPTLTISPASTNEGDSGAKAMFFNVTRSGFAAVNVSVAWNTVENTALAGSDYVGTNGLLLLSSNQTSAQLVVNILGDDALEGNEAFLVRLTTPTNATLSNTQAIGTIIDDDYLILSTLGATNVYLDSATLRGTATAAETANVWFEWWSGGQTNRTPNQVVPAGTNATTVTRQITGLTPGVAYFYRIVGSTASGGTNSGSTLTFSTPALPSLTISPASIDEGDSGIHPLSFNVTRTGFADVNISVAWNLLGSGATVGSDLLATNGLLTLASNQMSAQIVVNIIGDDVVENNETFLVRLTNPTNATLSATQAIGTIINDDFLSLTTLAATNIYLDSALLRGTVTAAETATIWFEWWGSGQTNRTTTQTVPAGTNSTFLSRSITGLTGGVSYFYRLVGSTVSAGTNFGAALTFSTPALPTLSISSASINEGDSGAKPITFNVTRSGFAGVNVTVEWTTVEQSAAASLDFIATNGLLSLASNQLSATFVVNVIGDDEMETNESFVVELSNPTNAVLSNTLGTGVILDDDLLSLITLEATNVFLTSAALRGTVMSATTADVWFEWWTDGVTNRTPSQIVQVTNETSIIQTVTNLLPGKTYTYRIAGAVAVGGTNYGADVSFVTPALPALTIAPSSASEGTSGVRPLIFTVTRTGFRDVTVGVAWSTAPNSASAGSDYLATNGVLLLASNQTVAQLMVNVVGDTAVEMDESFFLRFTNPTNATLSNTEAVGTIVNDDYIQLVTAQATNVIPNSATLRGNVAAAEPASVWFEWWADGLTNQTAPRAIPASTNQMLVSQAIVGLLPGKSYGYRIAGEAGPSGTNYGAPVSFATLALPVLTIQPASVAEGHSGLKPMVFTVTRTGFLGLDTSFEWQALGNSASAGSDFIATNGVSILTSNQTSAEIIVNIVGDEIVENNESLIIRLSNPTNATLSNTQAIGTILNDDPANMNLAFEAESGDLRGPMQIYSNALAFASRYISSPNTRGSVSYSFNIVSPGDYVVWCRVLATSTDDDSFLVSANGGPTDIFNVAQGRWTNVWQWSRVNGQAGTTNPLALDPRLFTFAAGPNTLSVAVREEEAKLDRIILTTDLSFVPTESPPVPHIPARLAIVLGGTNGQAFISMTGRPGGIYDLERSADFSSWETHSTFTNLSGSTLIAIPVSGPPGPNFYRARELP